MKGNSFKDISDTCIKTVKKNTPEKSIDIISKLINPNDGKSIGKKKALDIYISLISYAVPYEKSLYSHNFTLYQTKKDKKIEKAKKHVNKVS